MNKELKIKITPSEPHKLEGVITLRDIILGGQDGLVNVLGLILGIAVASGDLRIILVAGLAGGIANSVSMAAVAYTATRAQQSLYEAELEKEKREIRESPEKEKKEIRELYRQKGFSGKLLEAVVEEITSDERVWLDEMVKSELGLQPMESKNAFVSSGVVGLAAVVGSLIPLLPFILLPILEISINNAILLSLASSLLVLFLVGAYKAKATLGDWKKSGAEIAVIGIVSALIGYAIGQLFRAPTGG